MGEPLLETRGVSKDFSSVYVLTGIDIQVLRGEILGIIGENGAGKSTLMKILGGIHVPTSGQILFEGKPVRIQGPLDAKRLGIALIPQEFNLINQLTVYDNVFLGSELRLGNGLLDKKTMMARTRELLAELNVDIGPEVRVEKLSTAQKQMVEICKAVSINAKLLIMDEPTTVLTQFEIDILFRLMRRLRDQGTTIIYISHKLKEVKTICDRLIILRDGSVVSTEKTENLSIMDMAQRMVGRELSQVFPEKHPPAAEVVLEVQELTVPGVIENVSFQLHRGEILGLAGLVGAGRTEIAETILGVRRAQMGRILVRGRPVEISRPVSAVANGISYLSEDRQGSGILVSFSVVKNISLVSLASYCRSILGLILRQKERASAAEHARRFAIKAPDLDTRLEFLSGGNQQKVSLAKTIDPKPAVLIADEPTRGVDVSAKQEIYRLISSLAAEGLACLFISSEQEEIIGMCHRVLVMKQGQVMGSLEAEHITEEEIMFLATGIREGAR